MDAARAVAVPGELLVTAAPIAVGGLAQQNVLVTTAGAEESVRRLNELQAEAEDILRCKPIVKPKSAENFFSDVKRKEGTAQQLSGTCMFCKRRVVSTGASKLVDHLINCQLCVDSVKLPLRSLRQKTSSKRKMKIDEKEVVEREVEHQREIIKAQKSELRDQNIRSGFKSAEVQMADEALARFWYSNALPFGTADTSPSSYYMQMVRAIQAAPPGYMPPNKNKLGGPLLDSVHDTMLKDIANRDPQRLDAEKFGIAVSQDGWDSTDNLPLINSAYIMANNGGVYLRSVDSSGHTKDAEYIASLLITDIYSIGCQYVVMVVTDTCATMVKAWAYVMDEFPWVSCIPCIPHVASLLMKDIGKLPKVEELIKHEGHVVNWFSNHQKPLAILRRKVLEKLGKRKELVKAGATRFGTNTLVGQRLQDVKDALVATVVDAEYVAEKYKDLPPATEAGNCVKITREHKGGTAKMLVLDDQDITKKQNFWSRVGDHVKATSCQYTSCCAGTTLQGPPWARCIQASSSSVSSSRPSTTRASSRRRSSVTLMISAGHTATCHFSPRRTCWIPSTTATTKCPTQKWLRAGWTPWRSLPSWSRFERRRRPMAGKLPST